MKTLNLQTNDGAQITAYTFAPILKKGSPKVLITAMLHGDESTAKKVAQALIEKLKNEKLIGTVTIIPKVNEAAAKIGSRRHPEDDKDLNRQFKNIKNKTASNHLADELMKLAEDYDYGVDLHVFPGEHSPVVTVCVARGDEKVQAEAERLQEIVGPDVIWKLDPFKGETEKFGTLMGYLLNKGKPAFGIEMPPEDLVLDRQLEKIVNGLIKLLIEVKIIEGTKPQTTKNIPRMKRQLLKIEEPGRFVPATTKLLKPVSKGQVMGTFYPERTNKPVEIVSPFSGPLMTIAQDGPVTVGEKFIAVGLQLSW
ncbi:hypothetical protein CL634_05895 [bacterium]|nr:hypothetical protein [bacterium]|tara:strand:+ start:126 stop:1055 length:930 start_codon:yes stop_codon:yes gene_type:complete